MPAAKGPRVWASRMAVASVVPAKWWRWRLALALASSFLVSFGSSEALGAAAASAQMRARLLATAPDRARTTSSGVTLAVSDSYAVNVPAGSWVPVAVSVVNHRASDLQGQVIVSVPVAQMNTGESCSASGIGFICGASFAPPSGYSSGAKLPEVTYQIPLSLAAGISKQFVAYVLAESPYGKVQALIRTQSGAVLAKATAPLPVAYGAPQPTVLVVTQSTAAVPTMAELVTPIGSHPQLQYTVPADLPVSAAALGGFSAVAIDEADTSVLSPAQSMALEGYVDAGGTLVVAGGIDWRAATAGLPAGLLPAVVDGLRSPMAAAGAGRLARCPPEPGRCRPGSFEAAERYYPDLGPGAHSPGRAGATRQRTSCLVRVRPAGAAAGYMARHARLDEPRFRPGVPGRLLRGAAVRRRWAIQHRRPCLATWGQRR